MSGLLALTWHRNFSQTRHNIHSHNTDTDDEINLDDPNAECLYCANLIYNIVGVNVDTA